MNSSDNIDQIALQKLTDQLGSVLEGDHLVDFYFYFPEEYQAHQASAALINLQFKTEVMYSEYGSNWLCLAAKKIDMNSDRLYELRSWMEDLAESNGGVYDGWGTMIILDEED